MDLKTEVIKAEGGRMWGEGESELGNNARKKIKWREVRVVCSCHIES